MKWHDQIKSFLTRLDNYKYTIITRKPEHLEAVMKKFNLKFTDTIDPETSISMSEILGVQALCFHYGNSKTSSGLRMTVAETGQIIFDGIIDLK